MGYGSASETPDSDNSSLDDDDDIDSDDERFKTDNSEETEDDHENYFPDDDLSKLLHGSPILKSQDDTRVNIENVI
jgi:hypothetical protein